MPERARARARPESWPATGGLPPLFKGLPAVRRVMASQGLRLIVAGLAVGGLAMVATVTAQGGIDATVTEKAHDGHGTYVVATTEVGSLEFQRYVPTEEWTVVQEGDAVVYDVLSGETSIYTWERGSLIWRG